MTEKDNPVAGKASGAILSLDVGQGAIELNVAETLRFGNQLNMSLLNGNDPHLIQIYTSSQNQVVIGTDLDFFGQLVAPHAEVAVSSRSDINGSIYANRVVVDTDTHIIGPGCAAPAPSEYPLGADTMTRTVSIWWPDYHTGVVSTVDGLRFSFENVTQKSYTAVAKIRLFGPQGAEWRSTLGQRVMAPGDSASFTISAAGLGLRSETSAMQAQPEIVLNRIDAVGSNVAEKRLVPPIYFRHKPQTSFNQIELFDEATLISERGGKLAWGSGATVSQGDLLGYKKEGGSMVPIYAGQGEKAKIFNEQGEVVGYKLGSKLGVSE